MTGHLLAKLVVTPVDALVPIVPVVPGSRGGISDAAAGAGEGAQIGE